jgi:hypothetical protein
MKLIGVWKDALLRSPNRVKCKVPELRLDVASMDTAMRPPSPMS